MTQGRITWLEHHLKRAKRGPETADKAGLSQAWCWSMPQGCPRLHHWQGRGLIALGGAAVVLLHMWLCRGHSTARHVVRNTAAKASYIPGHHCMWHRPGYNSQ